jgi:hypothetical protein
MLDDARFAIRTLLHSRGFTAAAVVTLGIGIGANAVVFGVVDGLLLRPLPFGDRSGRLITLHSTHPTQATDWDDSDISYPDLVDLREGATTLEGIEGVVNRNVSLTASADAGDTERVLAASVTPGLFALLGVEPQLGRGFRDDEGAAAGAETVAIVSDSLWRRFFGSAPDIVGRPVPVNGRTLTVIGVMPPRFAFPEHRELWLPYRLPRGEGRDRRSMLAIGLVREGITLQAARGEVQALAADLAARFPATNQHWGVYAQPLRDYFVSDATRRGLAALLVSVVFVLLVACANIGSLLLARGIGRQREIAVRTALGAGRARLVRLLMTESLVLAAGGGVLGVLCAGWGLDALVASNPEPPPGVLRGAVGPDGNRVRTASGAARVAHRQLERSAPRRPRGRVTRPAATAGGARGGPDRAQLLAPGRRDIAGEEHAGAAAGGRGLRSASAVEPSALHGRRHARDPRGTRAGLERGDRPHLDIAGRRRRGRHRSHSGGRRRRRHPARPGARRERPGGGNRRAGDPGRVRRLRRARPAADRGTRVHRGGGRAAGG